MQGALCSMFLGTLFSSLLPIYECVSTCTCIPTLKQLTTNIDIISLLHLNLLTKFNLYALYSKSLKDNQNMDIWIWNFKASCKPFQIIQILWSAKIVMDSESPFITHKNFSHNIFIVIIAMVKILLNSLCTARTLRTPSTFWIGLERRGSTLYIPIA